jgi:tRNA (cytidine32/uridine32-2'-O)-methyltransferase
MLANIRVVLVNTSHPGNIGAAARAMKTMRLEKLYLVQPEKFPCAEATARASGSDDVLAAAHVCDSLDAALAGCSLVFGASARLRTIVWPQVGPRECAQLAVAESAGGEVALVPVAMATKRIHRRMASNLGLLTMTKTNSSL